MAHDDPEYTDLPAWCRPGALVGLTSWPLGSSTTTARQARIVRITKTRVVYTFTVNGREVEDFVLRTHFLNRYPSSGRSGAQLYQLSDPAFRDILAVQRARNLKHEIGKLFALRADKRKPLATRDDALDLLDEVAAAVAALRVKLAAEVEADGA